MFRLGGFCLTLAVAVMMSAAAFAQDSSDESFGGADFLFVQTATGVTFADGKMTLTGLSPSMIFFSDRPERMAGHVPVTQFLKIWDEGKDSFKNDPPNAAVSILGEKEGGTDVIVEISNPSLSEKGELTYDVKILDGTPPEKGGLTSLVIDWWVGPAGAVCWRNYYTGFRHCRFPGPYYYGPYPRPYWVY
ncbi:MAG: hypothetical protein KJ002_10350 [Candidatus Dadabacteria bacterium]|nr:hypothetical protein [Candidatus Dadabacteria bacterium]